MRRVLLFSGGISLRLTAGTILWNAPDLYLFTDSWHSAALTRTVGVAIIVEGVVTAFGAALCLARPVPLTLAPRPDGTAVGSAGGGPVLPLCGILFLLAAAGPLGEARRDAETLEVMDSMPGQWGADLVNDQRRHQRTERIFGVLWLAIGGTLLATPLLLKRRVWQLDWRMSGAGCGIAAGGLLLSGMGAFVWFANGLAMEGASENVSLAGNIGVLAGAIVAVVGSVVALAGKKAS